MKKAALVLFLAAGTLSATPPPNYPAMVSWTDETVKTSVSKEERIYVIGPEKVTETYSLNGKPATHQVEMRRIVSAEKVHAISDLQLTRFGKMPLTIRVYRAAQPILPFLTTGNTRSHYFLLAGDVVLVEFTPLPPAF